MKFINKNFLIFIVASIVLGFNFLVPSASATTYSITVYSDPSDAGSITEGGNYVAYAPGSGYQSYYYSPQQSVSLRATPSSGWQFDYWEGDVLSPCVPFTCGGMSYDYWCACWKFYTSTCKTCGISYAFGPGEVSTSSTNPLNVTMEQSRSVYAHFKKVYTSSGSQNYTTSGSVNPSGAGAIRANISPSEWTYITSGSVTYPYRTNMSLTALPNLGYSFSGWYTTSGLFETANPYSFTLWSNRSLIANFVYLTPPDPADAQVKAIDHGFEVFWSAPSPPPPSYKIYKSINSSFSPSTSIQTTSMKNGGLSFSDNRIQNPSSVTSTNPLYYKIVSVNASGGESSGVTVNTANSGPVQYNINMTIKGSGFISGSTITIALVNGSEIYNCGQFTYQDSNTVTGKCNITETPTGTFDVEVTMVNNGQTTKAILPSGFQITYPKPVSPDASVASLDLSNGKLIISSVQGDNLYVGAEVVLVVKDGSGKILAKQTCFNLGDFDWSSDPQKFPGGECIINQEIRNATNGDYSKIKIEIANDENSTAASISRSFSCNVDSWTPEASTICVGTPFAQNSNCGTAQTNAAGTMPINWAPSASNYCPSANTPTQISTNCSPIKQRDGVAGTMTCSSGQTCQNNACVDCVSTTWTPDTSTVCSGTAFTQTSDCSTTRSATGTKNCNVCTAESDATFCSRLGKNCDSVTAADNCGTSRTVGCGTCNTNECASYRSNGTCVRYKACTDNICQ
jgi:hypothetical protein